MNTTLIVSTSNEVQRRIKNNGMTLITKDELKKQLERLGYKIDENQSHNYINKSSSFVYAARSVYITDVKTGLKFSTIGATQDNLTPLQYLRRWHFCYENGRIWEL